MNTTLRTETPALITLMEHWAKTIAKNGGVAAVSIQEGADRIRELEAELIHLRNENNLLKAAQKISEETEEPFFREVLEARSILAAYDAAVATRNRLKTELAAMQARAEKAEADTARMDWLEREALEDWGIRSIDRASIDTAMKEASK